MAAAWSPRRIASRKAGSPSSRRWPLGGRCSRICWRSDARSMAPRGRRLIAPLSWAMQASRHSLSKRSAAPGVIASSTASRSSGTLVSSSVWRSRLDLAPSSKTRALPASRLPASPNSSSPSSVVSAWSRSLVAGAAISSLVLITSARCRATRASTCDARSSACCVASTSLPEGSSRRINGSSTSAGDKVPGSVAVDAARCLSPIASGLVSMSCSVSGRNGVTCLLPRCRSASGHRLPA